MTIKLKDLSFFYERGIHAFAAYWSNYRIKPKPSVMYFELTYRCTCRCLFCERWKIGPSLAKNELTTDEIKQILNDAYKIGVRYVGFTGGEAFLRNDIFEIGGFAKKLGFNVTVASNGTLIDTKNIRKIANNFSSVTISLDGMARETHDYIRGVKGVYDRAMKSIDLLEKFKIPLAVNLVITKKNFREIDDYIGYFSKRGIYFQLTPVHENNSGFFKVQKSLKETDQTEFCEEWQKLSCKYPILNNDFYKYVPTFLTAPTKLLKTYTCFAGAVSFFINPYGDVFPCEFRRISMGNLKEKKLSDIWNNAQKLRREISSSKRSCVCWTHCMVPLNNRLTKFICLKNLINQ